MSTLGALRWENPPCVPSFTPPFEDVKDAIAHRHASPSLFSLGVRHEDHSACPIQVLDAHSVKLSFVPHAGIAHQDDDVPEELKAAFPPVTADRVPIHVDTELGAKDLLNCRMPMSRSHVDAMRPKFIRIMRRRWNRNSVATCPIPPQFSKSRQRKR